MESEDHKAKGREQWGSTQDRQAKLTKRCFLFIIFFFFIKRKFENNSPIYLRGSKLFWISRESGNYDMSFCDDAMRGDMTINTSLTFTIIERRKADPKKRS